MFVHLLTAVTVVLGAASRAWGQRSCELRGYAEVVGARLVDEPEPLELHGQMTVRFNGREAAIESHRPLRYRATSLARQVRAYARGARSWGPVRLAGATPVQIESVTSRSGTARVALEPGGAVLRVELSVPCEEISIDQPPESKEEDLDSVESTGGDLVISTSRIVTMYARPTIASRKARVTMSSRIPREFQRFEVVERTPGWAYARSSFTSLRLEGWFRAQDIRRAPSTLASLFGTRCMGTMGSCGRGFMGRTRYQGDLLIAAGAEIRVGSRGRVTAVEAVGAVGWLVEFPSADGAPGLTRVLLQYVAGLKTVNPCGALDIEVDLAAATPTPSQ